jgi:predicted glycosyltransferase
MEQHMRATAFANRGLVSVVATQSLTPHRLAAAMHHALQQGRVSEVVRARWDGNGLSRIADQIGNLLPVRSMYYRRTAS